MKNHGNICQNITFRQEPNNLKFRWKFTSTAPMKYQIFFHYFGKRIRVSTGFAIIKEYKNKIYPFLSAWSFHTIKKKIFFNLKAHRDLLACRLFEQLYYDIISCWAYTDNLFYIFYLQEGLLHLLLFNFILCEDWIFM